MFKVLLTSEFLHASSRRPHVHTCTVNGPALCPSQELKPFVLLWNSPSILCVPFLFVYPFIVAVIQSSSNSSKSKFIEILPCTQHFIYVLGIQGWIWHFLTLKSSKIDMRSNKGKCRILGSYRKVIWFRRNVSGKILRVSDLWTELGAIISRVCLFSL